MTREDEINQREWARSRPPVIRALIRRFPPGSIVKWRENREAGEHSPDLVAGRVGSYFESGQIGVRHQCANGVYHTHPIKADDLEVVEVVPGLGFDWAARILEGLDE